MKLANKSCLKGKVEWFAGLYIKLWICKKIKTCFILILTDLIWSLIKMLKWQKVNNSKLYLSKLVIQTIKKLQKDWKIHIICKVNKNT